MKKTIVFLVAVLLGVCVRACPACEAAQPKLLKGVVHGRGPENGWDYLILCTALVVFLLSLFYSVKFLVRPRENSAGHIKYFILNEE
jgi:hypothetical protein